MLPVMQNTIKYVENILKNIIFNYSRPHISLRIKKDIKDPIKFFKRKTRFISIKIMLNITHILVFWKKENSNYYLSKGNNLNIDHFKAKKH